MSLNFKEIMKLAEWRKDANFTEGFGIIDEAQRGIWWMLGEGHTLEQIRELWNATHAHYKLSDMWERGGITLVKTDNSNYCNLHGERL